MNMHDGGGVSGEDLFGMLGGGGGGLFSMFGGGHGRGRRQKMKGDDTVQPLPVTLEDLYKGKTSKLQLTKKVTCKKCDGRGGAEGAVQNCSRCKGQGRVMVTRQVGPGMIQQMQQLCTPCGGEGQVIDEKNKCRTCNAKKVVNEQKIIEVNITPGMRDNQKIVFYNEGDQEPGIEPGDVILVIKTKEHPQFIRKNDDLYLKQEITLNEALCGFQSVITHLDGRKILLTTKPGQIIKPDSVQRVIGEGMPKKDNAKGNLYVMFSVNFPENHFLPEESYKQLETCLPKRPAITIPEDHEEVSLGDFDERGYAEGRRGEAYHDDEDSDEDMTGGHSGQRVQCASQ